MVRAPGSLGNRKAGVQVSELLIILEKEYADCQEAIVQLANLVGIDAESCWDNDGCPNNSDMVIQIIDHIATPQQPTDFKVLHAVVSQSVRDHAESLLICGIDEEEGICEETIRTIADEVVAQFTPPRMELG